VGGSRFGVEEWVVKSLYTLGPVVPDKLSHGPKTTLQGFKTILQGKADSMVAVIDEWKQLHTNATLLKPPMHSHSLFRIYKIMTKPSGKQDFCCSVWIVHDCT